MPNPFLSDAWLDEVQKLAAEAGSGMMPDAITEHGRHRRP